MKKTYCDVCGINHDEIEPGVNAIELAHPIEMMKDGTEIGVVLLPDMCWVCREEIAGFILKRMKDAKIGEKKD